MGKLPIKKILIGIAILVFLIWFIFFFGGPLTFLSFFAWLANKAADAGMNIWLAKTIAVPLAFLLFYAVLLIFSIHQRKRIMGIVLVGVFLVVGCFTMYEFTQDQYFNKWYSRAPNGYRIYTKAGIDPITGEKLERITPEIAREIEIWKKHRNETLQPIKEKTLFFDNWGRPIRWYYRYPNGKIEIFKWKGFHPTTGEELLPVTKEIVQEYLKQLALEEQKMSQLEAKPKTTPVKKSSPQASVPKVAYEEKIIETPMERSQGATEQLKEEIAEIISSEQKQLPANYKEVLEKYGDFVTANYDPNSGTYEGLYKNILIRFEDPDYKEIWVPETNKDPEWKPYQDGKWQDYENNTYIWISNEPFGYIAYHFGRWQWHPELGWYWIPTYEWGPAWVSWYHSTQYVFWTPLHYDSQYYRGFSKYYTKTDPRVWLGVKKDQLKNPNLYQIAKTTRIPAVKIQSSKIIPNAQTYLSKSPTSQSHPQNLPTKTNFQQLNRSLIGQPQPVRNPTNLQRFQPSWPQPQKSSFSLKDVLQRNKPPINQPSKTPTSPSDIRKTQIPVKKISPPPQKKK